MSLIKKHQAALNTPRARTILDDDYAGGDEKEYGVSKDPHGNVVLTLGPVPPFALPPDRAIKLAMLILKYAGCDVSTEGGRTDG